MYNNDFIYDWNIDGLSEHEILNVLCQLAMASTAYLTNEDDHNAVQLILAGFSRTLKYWWDNCLNDKERIFIQLSVNDEGEQNAVLRLMYAITKHFIGDPKVFEEINFEILQNLRCRTLSDFRWYHDVVLSKVMTRQDARAPYWKERFIYGLLRTLIEKVQETLREKHNGTILYEDLTYRDFIGEVKKEGLKLCSQFRLQYQIKRDLKASKKDLESFCTQYGIEMPVPPSQKHYKKQSYKKYKKYKSHKTKDNKSQIPSRKHKREVRCFKCGQKGHIAPNCTKQKLNILSDDEEEYYSENDTSSSETDNSQSKDIT